MAINFDHTNSASITLRGPNETANFHSLTYVFPNTQIGEANLLISGEAPISSISGLSDALDSKVNISSLGTAAYVDTGSVSGTIPVLDENGKLIQSIIPAIAIRDVFEVDSSIDRTGVAAAELGDIVIATGTKENWVLAVSGVNAYQTASNWKKIKFIDQVVTSVNGYCGDVVVNGSDINIASGFYIGNSVDYALDDLKSVKADVSCLTNYYTKDEITGCLSLYQLTQDLNNTLNGYVQCSDFTTCISNYSTTTQINQCLTDYYVPKSETGSAASRNVGTAIGNVVEVQNDGKISPNILPKIAITDTFVINTSGSLTSLSDAEKGDIAIATGDQLNYILTGTDYSNISEWKALAAPLGTVDSVNSVEPTNGNVILNSSNIDVQNTSTPYDSSSITSALTSLYGDLTGISGTYVTVSCATGLLNNYVTTGAATGAFNTKSDVGHGHVISDVSGLGSCLSLISTFYTGAGQYSATQYGVNNLMNEANGDGSLAVGYGAKASQNYEMAHSAGWFSNVGDAQASKIVFKCETTTNSLTKIASINLDANSSVLFNGYVIGRANGKYAAYKVEGAALKGATNANTSLLDDPNYNIFVNTNDAFYLEAVANTTDGSVDLKVSGDSSAMKWVANVNVVKVK